AASTSSIASGSSVRSSAITSSLTQLVPSASRASRAVLTASVALRHPAVLGSARIPSSRSRPSRPSPPPSPSPAPRRRSTLRMDPVVSAVPDAISASRSTAWLPAPPVPALTREPSSSPATTDALSPAVGGPPAVGDAATLHRREEVHLRTGGQQRVVPAGARDHLAVDGHGHALGRQVEFADEGADGRALREGAALSIDG